MLNYTGNGKNPSGGKWNDENHTNQCNYTSEYNSRRYEASEELTDVKMLGNCILFFFVFLFFCC